MALWTFQSSSLFALLLMLATKESSIGLFPMLLGFDAARMGDGDDLPQSDNSEDEHGMKGMNEPHSAL